ncbi:membrane protein [Candidatus Methylomirabilis lanthanidiphila]|uniref:Membrane protein n=1 Tax=Candidatus Methylomirabilis lanthanidiphila TaxID=2211376 RepID=A0A564ZN47_9BACT|nr:phage holin family protein [Candidatus Methylomirabilis lanthanidiphila]VUZ86287.1 membrane protein [Candidatus Methylomirabilis lanthanidiphila]
MGFLIRLFLNALALVIVSAVIPGIEVRGVLPALAAAFFLGVVNAFIRPVLLILTLPLTIITLGLFIPLLNAALLKLVSLMIQGFEVHGFWSAVFGAILISLISGVLNLLINDRGRVEVIVHRHRNL